MIFVWFFWAVLVLAILGTAVTSVVRYLHQRELLELSRQKDRCPVILAWTVHEVKNAMTTRCTELAGHPGPHHCKKPVSDNDHWWNA